MHDGHRYRRTGVVSIALLPQRSDSLQLGIEMNTALAIEVEVSQDGASAASLLK